MRGVDTHSGFQTPARRRIVRREPVGAEESTIVREVDVGRRRQGRARRRVGAVEVDAIVEVAAMTGAVATKEIEAADEVPGGGMSPGQVRVEIEIADAHVLTETIR